MIIGLTGNIACGKSTVLKALRGLGAHTIDADTLSHQVMEPDGPAYRLVLERFGESVLAPDGTINRGKLGRIVFSDPKELRALERIIHPLVSDEIRRTIRSTDRVIVIDAIKLLESDLSKLCDQIWVVTCTEAQQIERLRKRNRYSEEEALLRIRAQPPQEEKIRAAAVVIDTSGSRGHTREQVLAAWDRIEQTENQI